MRMLFGFALKELKSDESLAKSYIRTLTRISEHYHIRMDPGMRAGICRRCMLPLVPGYNAGIRVIAGQNRKIIRCSACGASRSLVFAQHKRINRP